MRTIYERSYGPAPAGARFGADVSWWQAAANDAPHYPTAYACWQDRLTPWAEWVCCRVTVGAGQTDATWPLHMQAAAATGYRGTVGAYHFAYPNLNTPDAEAANFLRQWEQHPWQFAMLDMEIAGPGDVASWAARWCDTVADATGQQPMLYTAAWFTGPNMRATDAAQIPLWVAHYAGSGTWNPGGDVNTNTPWLPAWSNHPPHPVIWQYTSTSPELGHLDLNMAADPTVVAHEPPSTSKEWWEMPMDQAILPDGRVYVLFGMFMSHVPNPSARAALANWGMIEGDPRPCNEWDLEPFTDVSRDVFARVVAGAQPSTVDAGAVRQAVEQALAGWQPQPAQPAGPPDLTAVSNAELLNELDRRIPK